MSWNDIKVGDNVVWNGDPQEYPVVSVTSNGSIVTLAHEGVRLDYYLSTLKQVAKIVKTRLPKYNEIWTRKGAKYKFVAADDDGKTAWMGEDNRLRLFALSEMVPPVVKPDDSVLANMWINVYPSMYNNMSAEYTDNIAHYDRVGRVNLLGEWVDCDGREVLG